MSISGQESHDTLFTYLGLLFLEGSSYSGQTPLNLPLPLNLYLLDMIDTSHAFNLFFHFHLFSFISLVDLNTYYTHKYLQAAKDTVLH